MDDAELHLAQGRNWCHAAAQRSLPVVATGVSHMPDLGFIVLVIVVFVLIGLIAKGVSRL
ncbi:hypothetical protein ACIREM_31745 [Streptomyces shenzhenensis]|uniref:hypothetical protein n=1 Tax=Streptomyces shenzhenensis TaxID=943815 RepID=UPI0038154655